MFSTINNPFFLAFSNSDLFGKAVFFGLFFLSILSWTILLYKIWMMAKVKKFCLEFEKIFTQNKDRPLTIPDHFTFNTESLKAPYLEIYKTVKSKTFEILEKNRYFSEKKESVIYLSEADIDLVETHAYSSMSKESKFLEKYLFVLPTVMSLGPFLGLLGTVWGMLVTFSGLHTHSLVTSNQTVLSGLSMALATTVLGLLVAIPALIAHNYLKSAIRDFKKDMENFSHFLLTTIEMQYRRVDNFNR